jgi:2-polyprenyl-3-methyl-5-hydroxy-6-metoxy-1,4-benzoquinol methylase
MEINIMELSPRLYHWFVRPRLFTNLYINSVLQTGFDFSNSQVLDFGCGIGSSSSIFNPHCYLGVDPDDKRVNYAKQLYPAYQFQCINGKDLQLKKHSLDYIVMIAVLHHISSEEIFNYLQQFKSALKTDGRILVIEPCLSKDAHLSNLLMNFFDNGPYIRDEKSYIDLFEMNHFRTSILKQFKKFFYNEIFLTAALN